MDGVRERQGGRERGWLRQGGRLVHGLQGRGGYWTVFSGEGGRGGEPWKWSDKTNYRNRKWGLSSDRS